jgi:hypothetical protein
VQAQWIHPSVKVDILLPLWSPYFDNQRVITTVILTREHSHSECRLDWHPLLGCWKKQKGKPHPHGSKWWHLLQCDILICNALPLSIMMFIYIHIFFWKPESDHLIIIFPFSAAAIFWASPFPDTQINEIPTFSGVNLILSL